MNANILELEQKYWQAMQDNDVEAGIALTRFPCIISGPQGTKKITEADYRNMMKSNPANDYKNVKIEKPVIEFLNDNTALITYSTKVKGMDMLDVSTWVRDGERWACAFHSENPFTVH